MAVNLNYSRTKANPPRPDIIVEASAHEAVFIYREWAATKQMQ